MTLAFIMDLEFEYSGEMDEQGRAHGYGTAVEKTGRPLRCSGTFKHDQAHGFCK